MLKYLMNINYPFFLFKYSHNWSVFHILLVIHHLMSYLRSLIIDMSMILISDDETEGHEGFFFILYIQK